MLEALLHTKYWYIPIEFKHWFFPLYNFGSFVRSIFFKGDEIFNGVTFKAQITLVKIVTIIYYRDFHID